MFNYSPIDEDQFRREFNCELLEVIRWIDKNRLTAEIEYREKSLEEEIEDLESDIDSLEKTIDELETLNSELEDKIFELENKCT